MGVKRYTDAESKQRNRLNQAKFHRKKRAEKYHVKRHVKIKDVLEHEIKVWTDKECVQQGIPRLIEFLKYYFKNHFTINFNRDQIDFIELLQNTIMNGGNSATAFPRGSGKSTIIQFSTIWAILYNFQKYVVVISSKAVTAKMQLKKIQYELENNDLLYRDYRTILEPIRNIQGTALRAKFYKDDKGKSIGFEWNSEKISMPSVDGFDNSGAIIQTSGISASVRGFNSSISGMSCRPSLILIDDVLTSATATSKSANSKILNIINSDILGLSSPLQKISVLLVGTIIERGDVIDVLTNKKANASWHGMRISMLKRMPDDTAMKLWQGEYKSLRDAEFINNDNHDVSNKFYKDHFQEMNKGAVHYWNERYESDEISAIQNAMDIYLFRGEKAFYSEYQNKPVSADVSTFEMKKEDFANALSGFDKLKTVNEHVSVTVGIDLNRYGLTYSVIATTQNLYSQVLQYGVYVPEGKEKIYEGKGNVYTEAESLAFYNALAELCGKLETLNITNINGETQRIRRIGIDAGYMYSTVRQFVQRNQTKYKFELYATRGRANYQYRGSGSNVIKSGNGFCLIKDALGEMLIFNSDINAEETQKAFSIASGGIGSISLYGNSLEHHSEYIAHIQGQRLIEKLEGKTGLFYKWQVNGRNDYLDSLIISRILAKYGGADVLCTARASTEGVVHQNAPAFKEKPFNRVSYDNLSF